jgi:hypothetical protein
MHNLSDFGCYFFHAMKGLFSFEAKDIQGKFIKETKKERRDMGKVCRFFPCK